MSDSQRNFHKNCSEFRDESGSSRSNVVAPFSLERVSHMSTNQFFEVQLLNLHLS